MDNIIPWAYKCNKSYKLHLPIGYMRPSMLYNYSNKAGTIYPFLSVRTSWSGIGHIAILRFAHVRQASAASRKPQAAPGRRTTCHYSKPQVASRRPAGVQRDIIAIMPRHSRKAGPGRGRYPRFQWARARFFADFGLAGHPVIKINFKPPSLRFIFTLVFPHVPNKNQNKRPSSSK